MGGKLLLSHCKDVLVKFRGKLLINTVFTRHMFCANSGVDVSEAASQSRLFTLHGKVNDAAE